MIKKILFIPILFLTFISCNTELEINNENVSGVWKADVFVSTVPGIPQEYVEAGEKEFLSSVYTLNDDNSMNMKSDYFSNGAPGNWELNPETKELSMFYTADTINGIEKFIITSLSKHQMILRQDIEEMDAYVELTLKK